MQRYWVIVATTEYPLNGIGFKNDLPWKNTFPEEIKYFKDITTTCSQKALLGGDKQNVVIMGRNTWQSIPSMYRPLKGRLNIVLSTTKKFVGDPPKHVFPSLDDAMHHLQLPHVKSTIDRIFIAGGAQLYNEAMNSNFCAGIYMTRIKGEFECDTFINKIPLERFYLHSTSESRNGIHQIYHSYRHPELDYLSLLRNIINNGEIRDDRTGVGTRSLFGTQLRFDLQRGFPLITTKKVFFRGIVEELLWFLRGNTNSKLLSVKGIKIWDANATREFLDKRKLADYDVGDLGPVYGFQWRHWGEPYKGCNTDYTNKGIDQINRALDLIKTHPTSRRIIVSAWNVADIDQMVLPPCHLLMQFQVSNKKLNCSIYQRSADMGLGVPFNIASYALLVHLMAHATDLEPGSLVMSFGDCHVYLNHIDQLNEQINRNVYQFPKLTLLNDKNKVKQPWDWEYKDIKLEEYTCHPAIKLPFAI